MNVMTAPDIPDLVPLGTDENSSSHISPGAKMSHLTAPRGLLNLRAALLVFRLRQWPMPTFHGHGAGGGVIKRGHGTGGA